MEEIKATISGEAEVSAAFIEPTPNGGGSYVLPPATSNALGGVKADPKQSGDVQPVHIDSNGKLWTANTGGGSYDDTELRQIIATKADEYSLASDKVFVVGDIRQDESVRNAVVDVAKTYRDAQDGGKIFVYVDGHGCLKPLASNSALADVHDDSGRNIIDCSTYIGLVLRGYSYEETHYHKSSLKRINPVNVTFGTGFAEKDFDQQSPYTTGLTYDHKASNGNKRILTASDMAKYYAEQGRLISMEDDRYTLQKGDIVFFSASADDTSVSDEGSIASPNSELKYPNRFLGISHVGIMYSGNYFYNATKTSGGVEGIVQSSVSGRRPLCYARPAYGFVAGGGVGGISDVQVNGTSIVSGGVANVPVASGSGFGAVKIGGHPSGIIIENGGLKIAQAASQDIDSRTQAYKPITSNTIDYAVTAVLTDGKAPALTDAQKAQAQSWLGIDTILGLVEAVSEVVG